jgi:hypothetical protein
VDKVADGGNRLDPRVEIEMSGAAKVTVPVLYLVLVVSSIRVQLRFSEGILQQQQFIIQKMQGAIISSCAPDTWGIEFLIIWGHY